MNGSFSDGRYGRSRGFGAARPGPGLWEAFEQLRASIERTGTPRMARGDVRAAVVALLAERPMHGYQIIQEIEDRSGGSWKPSPGSVYPALQLLADEGLISPEEANGRKTYTLTEAGRAEAETAKGKPAPWESADDREGSGLSTLHKTGFDLAQAVTQISRTGTSDQVKKAAGVLVEARRKIYAILAES